MAKLGWAFVTFAISSIVATEVHGQSGADAIVAAEKAAKLEFSSALESRGRRDLPAARRALERALSLAARCDCAALKGEIWNGLAVVSLDQGDALRAVDITARVEVAPLPPALRANFLNTRAEALGRLGRSGEAITELRSAVETDSEMPPESRASLIEALSIALRRSGRAGEAVELLRPHLASTTATAAGSSPPPALSPWLRFGLQRRLAQALFDAKRYTESRSEFSVLVEQAVSMRRLDVAVSCLRELSAAAEAGGDPQGAVDALNKALSLSTHGGSLDITAELSHQLAIQLVRMGRYEAARLAYEEALRGFTAAGQRRGVLRAKVGLGTLAGRVGSYALATSLLTEAINDVSGTDSPEVANARNSLANVYTLMNRFDDARIIYTRLLDQLIANDPRDTGMLGSVLVNLAVCYSRLHQPSEVRRYLESAQNLEIKDPRQRAVLLNNLALAYDAAGEQAHAVRLMQQSLDLRKSLGNPVLLAEGYANMAAIIGDRKYGARADFEGALKGLEMARRTLDSENLPRQKALYLANIGAALRNLDRYAESEKALVAARNEMEALGDEPGQISVLGNLGETYVAQKKYREAVAPYQSAISLIERVRLDASDDASRITLFESQKNYYATLVDLYAETGADQEAFAVMERGRSRALLDLLGDQDFGRMSPGTAGLRTRVHELRDQRLLLQRRLSAGAGDALKTLRERDAVTGELLEATKALTEASGANDRAGLDVVSIADLQMRTLRPGEVYVSFKLNARRLHVIVVTPNDFRLLTRRLEAEELRAQISRFTDAIRDQKPVQKMGHELYRLLLEPIEAQLDGARRVFLTADDALLKLPFEALSRADADDPRNYLLFSPYELVQVPSASVLSALRRYDAVAPPPRTPILLIGAPAYAPGAGYSAYRWMRDCADRQFTNLREAEGEVDAIAAAFGLGSDDQAVNKGPRATLSRLKSVPLEQFRYIHVVVHGVVCGFGKGSWEEPALAFAAENVQSPAPGVPAASTALLYASDIYQLRVGAELVTLSACESGLGESVSGEGVVGFARAFLASGARAVNASLWLVNDAATSVQMSRFYTAIADSKTSPTSAWKKVRQEFATNPPEARQSHPFFWAAFALYGDPK